MNQIKFDPYKLKKELIDRGYTMASASRAMGYSPSGLKGAYAKGKMTESMAASLDAIVGIKIADCAYDEIGTITDSLFDAQKIVNLPFILSGTSDDDFAGWLYEQIFRGVYNALTAWDRDRHSGRREKK